MPRPSPPSLLVVVAIAGLSCTPSESDPTDSGAAEVVGPKADATTRPCRRRRALLWLNDPTTGAATLRSHGLHARAARHLVDHRNGPDGRYPSADDRYFADWSNLDDIDQVGPVALDQIASADAVDCSATPTPEARVTFAPSPYEESHLVDLAHLFGKADDAIDVAIYRLGDDTVAGALEHAAARGLDIRVLVDNPGTKPAEDGASAAHLERAGVDVRQINRTLHHKFAVVDGPRETLRAAADAAIATGSANWTYPSAAFSDNSTVVFRGDSRLAVEFQREFNRLWRGSRPWGDEASAGEPLRLRTDMVPTTSGIRAHFTSRNFEIRDTERWGRVFTPLDDRTTVAPKWVAQIENADESIRIASTHFRSRPVAEALIRKHREDPEVAIEVYLDQTEHVSQSSHREQTDQLEDCLDRADDTDDRRSCRRGGFRFGYALQRAGISVRFKYYAYHWSLSHARRMHHKYMVVDGETLLTGSYNLSHHAERRSMENAVAVDTSRYPDLVEAFASNFDAIWATGRHRLSRLRRRIREADDEVPIVFEPMALNHGEVAELEGLIRRHCPAVDADRYDDHPARHETCSTDDAP